jgi:hypothetical protein
MVKHMDRFEGRLKDDAGRIRADISPDLEKRIRASLEMLRSERLPSGRERSADASLWLRSSLTGLVAAVLIIVLVNWRTPVERAEVATDPKPAGTIPSLQSGFPLNAETAEWTAPLEEELKNLQSDLEKARENVERDLRMSF